MADKDNAKGPELERRVGRVEFSDGALVRVRWPVVLSENGRKSLTDVDVFALDFDARLHPTVSIIECKSTRGQGGEYDRLLWLVGLQKFVGAERAVLVRENTTGPGRELARRLQVDLISTSELEERERELAWMPDTFAFIGPSPYVDEERRAAQQYKALGDLPPRLVSFIRHESLLADAHRTLGGLATLGEVTRKSSVLPETAARLLASHALVALVVAALRAAGRLDALGLAGLRSTIEEGILSGDPANQRISRVLELADAVVRDQASKLHRAYVDAGARPIQWDVPSLRQNVQQLPPWLPRFYDLAERMRRLPLLARQLPQTTDLACFDALSGSAAWRASAFDHLFTVEHRQLLVISLDLMRAALPELADHLEGLRQLPFDRVPPVPPDRRGEPAIRRGDASGNDARAGVEEHLEGALQLPIES